MTPQPSPTIPKGVSSPPRWQQWAATLIPALLALYLYLPTRTLPLIYDTLLHIRIAGNLDWRTVWLPNDAFGFYRPLTFVPMLLIKTIWGSYPPWLLHGLNIVHHSLNAALVARFAQKLWPNIPRRALLAGCLFATFPFSYQAIAVYGHNVHPATATLILLALLVYLKQHPPAQQDAIKPTPPTTSWRTLPQKALLPSLFLLALLSHESAILFGGFAALSEWQAFPQTRIDFWTALRTPRQKYDHLLRPWLGYIVAGAFYLVLYQLLPISRAPQTTAVDPGPLFPRLLYLLQAATYPFVPPLTYPNKLPATLVILLATTLTLLFFVYTYSNTLTAHHPLRAKIEGAFSYGLTGFLWWGAASLLIAIPLTTTYLLHGPRLLYLGSIGLALAWAAILTPTTFRLPIATDKPPLSFQPGTLIALFVLLVTTLFVQNKINLYHTLTATITTPLTQMEAYPSHHQTLLINLPDWLDAPPNPYPIGSDFVTMLGNYLFVTELVTANTRFPHPTWTTLIPELQQNPPYSYGLHQQTPFDPLPPLTTTPRHYFITRYADHAPYTDYTGWATTAAPDARAQAHFTHYTLYDARAAHCNGYIDITLTWQPHHPVPPTTTLFIQLLDNNGQLIAQADGPPLGLAPQHLTRANTLSDQRTIPFANNNTPTTLLIGAYDYTTGTRAPATLPLSNLPLANNAYPLPLSPCP